MRLPITALIITSAWLVSAAPIECTSLFPKFRAPFLKRGSNRRTCGQAGFRLAAEPEHRRLHNPAQAGC